MIAIFGVVAAVLGIAVVVQEWRTPADPDLPQTDPLFDGERALLERDQADELDDPARSLFGPWNRDACARVYEEIASL